MSRKEIIAKLKKNNQSDEDIENFLNLYDGQNFKSDIEMRLAYGKYFMERYGTHVVVEWDKKTESFNSL